MIKVWPLDHGESVLVRGTLDVHEALRAWADELDDGVIYDGFYDCAGVPRAGIDPEGWEAEPKDVVAFGDHVHDMISTAHVRYFRFRPAQPDDEYRFWCDNGTRGQRGSFPGVWFV